jgi:hypothetical protein
MRGAPKGVAFGVGDVANLLPVVTFPPHGPATVGLVKDIAIHRMTGTIAILCRAADDPETSTPLATVYLLKDGWHMKLTHRHDRFAWSGPYAAPEDAMERYTPSDATGPLQRIAV